MKAISLFLCIILCNGFMVSYAMQNFNRNRLKHSQMRKLPPETMFSGQQTSTTTIDKRIFGLGYPIVLNVLIFTLVRTLDTYWIAQMSDTRMLAGQSAATQVYGSYFWAMSFLPTVLTPLVSRAYGENNEEAIRELVGEAILIALLTGVVSSIAVDALPSLALRLVLPKESLVYPFAIPYLRVRSLGLMPGLIETVGSAVLRGTLNVGIPLQISTFTNLLYSLLDPLFIFHFRMGLVGAAYAKVVTDYVGIGLYLYHLIRLRVLDRARLIRLPTRKVMMPLLEGGASALLRTLSLNYGYVRLARAVQTLDNTGVAASAHAISMQLWQMGVFVLIALSTVATIIIPGEVAKSPEEARFAADRLLLWGTALGVVLAASQLACLPLLKMFSPSPAVQKAAFVPSIIGAVILVINGFMIVGEGIQQGNQCYSSLTITSALSTALLLVSLHFLGRTLTGVWLSLGVFSAARLLAVIRHHYFSGPLVVGKRG